MKPPLFSKEEICRMFGCTMEQLNAQYAKNAIQLREMAEKAEKSGKKYRGFTAAELWEHAKAYEALSK